MTPGKDDKDGQMVVSVKVRAGARGGLVAGRVAACGLALALAGCVQPGATPGASGSQRATLVFVKVGDGATARWLIDEIRQG